MNRLACLFALTAFAGCHHGTTEHGDLGASNDLSASSDLAAPGDAASNIDAAVCTRTQRPDGTRYVAVSHPFTDSGNPSTDYELLVLATDGTFTRPNTHFQMGVGTEGAIVFTPDGKVGYSMQDDGSLGIFTVSDSGAVDVVAAAYQAGPYATELVMGPAGDHLYVLDSDTIGQNGGGIYDLPIHCDGSLGAATLVAGADTPHGLARLPGGDYAMYARVLDGSPAGDNVHRLTLDPYARTASAYAAFAASPNVGSATTTHDGKYYLVGDNSGFSTPNSIAIAATASGITGVTTSMPDMGSMNAIAVNDPYAMVASPYDNAVLVVSGFGNAFYKLAYDPTNATTPFTNAGTITYKSGSMSPQLPGNAQLIDHGALANYVFVAELSGVRTVRFEPNGTITDLGLFDLGMASSSSLGILGVQP